MITKRLPTCPCCKAYGSARAIGGSMQSQRPGATDMDRDYLVQCQECGKEWYAKDFDSGEEKEVTDE